MARKTEGSTAKSGAKSGGDSSEKSFEGFSEEERAAMKEHAKELKAAARRGKAAADGEADVLAKIAEMEEQDRVLAERVHALVRATAPDLEPRLWYGMPAYAKGGKIVCHFQDARKFKTRYATLAFSDKAALDDGAMWPVGYALTEIGPDEEKRIVALLTQALA